MALQVTSLQILSSHNLLVYIVIYFQKATALLCLYIGSQLGLELVL